LPVSPENQQNLGEHFLTSKVLQWQIWLTRWATIESTGRICPTFASEHTSCSWQTSLPAAKLTRHVIVPYIGNSWKKANIATESYQ